MRKAAENVTAAAIVNVNIIFFDLNEEAMTKGVFRQILRFRMNIMFIKSSEIYKIFH